MGTGKMSQALARLAAGGRGGVAPPDTHDLFGALSVEKGCVVYL